MFYRYSLYFHAPPSLSGRHEENWDDCRELMIRIDLEIITGVVIFSETLSLSQTTVGR